MKKSTLTIAVAAALTGMLACSLDAFAAKGGIPGPPDGGDETAAQNLSVPTIMVGTAPGGLSCVNEDDPTLPKTLVPPTEDPDATPLTGYEVDDGVGYYWVQKVHTWQAQCFDADTSMGPVTVYGNWGDNLEGDASLKVGSPIRVEIVLTNEDTYPDLPSLLGYTVIKLEPSLLDRESAYGHLAGGDPANGFTDIPTEFDDQRTWLVHDSQITFSVCREDTGDCPVAPGTNPTAEINATGKVVYGYNLRLSEAGDYRIQFTSSANVVFSGQDALNGDTDYEHNAWIDIEVVPGGGGGGGKGKP